MRKDVIFLERFKLIVLSVLLALIFPVFTANSQPSILNVKDNAVVKFNNNSIVTINGTLDIGTGVTFQQDGIVSITGSWINNGNQTSSAGSVTFLGTGTQFISSLNATSTQFFQIIVNRVNSSDTIIVNANVFNASSGFLSLQNGFFRFSGTNTFANTFFAPISAGNFEIPLNTGFILDNSNVSVLAQSQEGSLFLRGVLHILNGLFTVGSTGQSKLIYDDANPAELKINGGELNIYTSLEPDNTLDNLTFTQTAGAVKVGTGSANINNSRGTFQLTSGSQFNVAGGTIELQRASQTNSLADFNIASTNGTVSGGTLVVNSSTANSTYELNSSRPIGNFELLANNNPIARLTSSLTVLNDVTLAGTGSGRFIMNNNKLTLGGDWTNNLASIDGFTQGTQAVEFNGSAVQLAQGSADLLFGRVNINKTGGEVELTKNARINGNLHLISANSLLNIKTFDLTLGEGVEVFSDDGIDNTLTTFTEDKCILYPGSTVNPLDPGKVIRLVDDNTIGEINLYYPIGTAGAYTPAEIRFHDGGATFGANASVSVKPIPQEHPEVETPDLSLTKYWAVKKNDITINTGGASTFFYYTDNEVQGTEGSYRILWYSPSYDDPSAFWRIDPGLSDDIVDFNKKFFYSSFVSEIDGDWVAGESEAAAAIYYARQDGDYNTPATWSKLGFNGPASTTAPNKLSDKVRIQDHTITISGVTAPANLISLENGTESRAPGKLIIQGNNFLTGDTLRIEQNTTFSIGHEEGLTFAPAATGAVRTSNRIFNSNVIYEFSGSNTQVTGNAIPNTVRCVRVDKPAGIVLSLSKNIAISDSLVINEGVLDVSAFSINGNSTNRLITMRGGELRLPTSFPSNYSTPSFTAGTINFNGVGNSTVPSSGSTPAVAQYNNLKISGTNRNGNITFSNLGEIRISNEFNISELAFANNSFRLFSDASTIRFNKSGGVQDIPVRPASPADSVCLMEYHNLILDGSGTKRIVATGSPLFKVLNNLTITNTADFVANGINIEIQNDWINQSGTFAPGTSYVIFRSNAAAFTNYITSRSMIDNPFNDVYIYGAGIVEPLDELRINAGLTIGATAELKLTDKNLNVAGNFTHLGGIFTPGTSTVRLDGIATQVVSRANAGNIEFNNLVVNNTQNIEAAGVGNPGNGIVVNGNLTLENGNIRSHIGTDYRFVSVAGNLTRPGNGYIDGELRKIIPTGANTTLYEVGYDKVYTPVSMEFTGTGGTSGFFGVWSDTLGVGTSPISWSDAAPTDILPLGAVLNEARHIARQYNLIVPSGSTFALGASREYNVVANFIPGNSPNGDLRNGADPLVFEARIRTASTWIYPFSYGTTPIVGTRTSSSFQFTRLKDFGTLVVGEPSLISYFTRDNGDWETADNWSTQGYGGLPSTTFPGQIGNSYKVYIGNNNTITLNSNKTITNLPIGNALVVLDSAGTMIMDQFTISGNGDFRMMKNSTLSIGDPAGITAAGATGNIRNSGLRNFNFGSHNLGNFVYTGGANQNSGNGLPSGIDSVLTLTVNKTGNTLTLNATSTVNVKEKVHIVSGSFSLGSLNLNMFGTFHKGAGATFIPNGRTVFVRGDNEINFVSDSYSEPLNFYNLSIGKSQNTGGIYLRPNTIIRITNNLNFDNFNKTVIDATEFSTEANPLYVGFDLNATVTGAGHINFSLPSGGWVYGEVRKIVPAGDAPLVLFETGSSLYYSPFGLDFYNGTGTAGELSGKAIAGNHPKLYPAPSELYPINPSRNVTVYWQLKKPNGSTFDRGNRAADYRVYLINPDQQTNTDCFNCADLAYYRGGDSLQWWQSMALNNSGENSNNGNGTCGDTRIAPHPAPSFTYSGNACSVIPLVFIQVNNVPSTVGFGTDELFANGDLLLADFVAGNRNSLKYYNFYSINDGDWSDPATWSTVSYSSTINNAASDNDPLIRPIPTRQYDNVYIGNGKKVKLDMFIGTNRLSSNPNANGFAGPSVFVENTGTLDFGTTVLRGNQFNAKQGSTLIIGANDGITTSTATNVGNVQGASYASGPKYNDSINVVYAPSGRTMNGQTIDLINRNSLNNYIESVIIRRASDNAIVLQHVTNDKYLLSSFGNYRANASCTLEVGQQYYVQVNPSNLAVNRKYKVWADWNFDRDMGAAGEQLADVNSSDTTLVTLTTFTVPASNDKGSTLLRIGMAGNTTDFVWNNANTTVGTSGEFEDYTIHINNPGYVASQVNGPGMPTLLQSFTLQSPNNGAANPQFSLNKSIIVLDDFSIKSGIFNQGANSIDIYGDFIHDTINGFVAHSVSPVRFIGDFTQNIVGTHPINFNNVEINKGGNNNININVNLFINGIVTHNSDNNLVLNTNNTITFEEEGDINSGSGSYSKNRMIKVDGNSNTSYVTKKFVAPGAPVLNYCSASLSGTNRWITNVAIGSWSNPSGASSYSDFTGNPGPTLSPGNTSITFTKNNADDMRYAVWIDLNQDGVFGTGEMLIQNVSNVSGTTSTQSFTLPSSAYNGQTRMRISAKRRANQPTDGCEGSSTNGEYEDYTVTITGATDKPVPPYDVAFLFPIGTGNVYNPADFDLSGTIGTTSSIAVLLKEGLHPNRITGGVFENDILNKYWRVQTTGITDVTSTKIEFGFEDADVPGDVGSYIPARYDGAWEINLGTNPIIENNTIEITPTFTDPLDLIDGDWTTGMPLLFFNGRKFYSIKNGDWNDRYTWSNIGHSGPRSQYFPGDIYFQDSVYIDGHTVTFKDSVHILIDTLCIGGTNPAPGQGILTFGLTPTNKTLELRQITTNENGLITSSPTGNRQDTINIFGSFENNSSATQQLWFTNDLSTHLKFSGSGVSEILGDGPMGNLANIVLNKSGGLADSLVISASGFPLASLNSPGLMFMPLSGVIRFDNVGNNYLSSNLIGVDILFQPNSGLHVRNATVSTRTSLITNSNTSFSIEQNGLLNIGNDNNESFLYGTGTSISLISGQINVAAGFSRFIPSSTIDLSLDNLGLIKVNTVGSTNATQIGFDISNDASTFNMTGGRVIVANKGASLYDYRVNASNGVISGGAIQIGDSTLTPAATEFRIGGTTPAYDLHLVSNGNIASTDLTEIVFNIKNDFIIDEDHTFKLNSNTVNLGGDIINYGVFDGTPGAPTTDAWSLVFNGTGSQNVFNATAPGLNVFNVRLEKPYGNVVLDALGNSNLIIRNSLEFSSSNNGFIEATNPADRYVAMRPASFGNDPQILRVGKGHVYGMLNHWVKVGAQNITYTVGADTIDSYRPVIFESGAGDNTPGYVGVRAYSEQNPDFDPVLVRDINDIEKYWHVRVPSVDGFALGAGATYDLTTFWVVPGDTIGLGNPNTFLYEHFIRTPGWADDNVNGDWLNREMAEKGPNYVKSTNNSIFGDYIVGEPNGVTFFSRNDGLWTDPNTWSIASYYADAVPSRYPNEPTDIVRIGNNKRVTIPSNLNQTIRSVFVEKDPDNQLPGELYILGNLGFLRGTSFVLEDDCTIGLQHLNGITLSGTTGAIQTDLRSFGVSRYVYNSFEGSQNTGVGLPDSVKTIVIDNPTTININKTVFLNKSIGTTLIVRDSVAINQGVFNAVNRNLRLYGTLVLDTIINNGVLNPAPLFFDFAGNAQKYLKINNRTGVTFNDLYVSGGDVSAFRTNVYQPANQHLRLVGALDFKAPSTITLGENVNLSVRNSSPSSILNYGADRYIRTSDTSGMLIRTVAAGNTYDYPIGSLDAGGILWKYTPAVFAAEATGTTGTLGIRTSSGRNLNVIGAHRFISTSPVAQFLLRYWAVDSVTTTTNGQLSFTYDNADIYNDENAFTDLGRWTRPFELAPGNWAIHTVVNNVASNTFGTTTNFSYQNFRGDWAFGNESAFRRIFYSRNSGFWNDDQNWTFDPSHAGAIFGAGVFPNNNLDSAVIGANHEIVMNNNYQIQGLAVGTTPANFGTLNLGPYIFSGEYFTLGDNSTLKIGHPTGIAQFPTPDGNIQTTISRLFTSPTINGNFEYIGTTNQLTGTGLPSIVRNLTINNSGPDGNNTVVIDKDVNIIENLNINQGKYDMSTYSVTKLVPSGSFNITANAYLRIGGNKNLLTAINNFVNYNVNIDSYIEFYGTTPDNQNINELPTALVSGLGYVNILNSGTKFVNAPLLIRRDLTIFEPATLENNVGVNSLQVHGNVVNRSVIENKGIIEIGQ